MERHERITGRGSVCGTLARGREQAHQRINHDVPDPVDFFRVSRLRTRDFHHRLRRG